MFAEHRYIELFLNSTERGSNGGYGGHMGGMGELLLCRWTAYLLLALLVCTLLLEGGRFGMVINSKSVY